MPEQKQKLLIVRTISPHFKAGTIITVERETAAELIRDGAAVKYYPALIHLTDPETDLRIDERSTRGSSPIR